MAKRKKVKQKAVKRKPTVPAKDKVDLILEYKGWSAGDRCYVVFAGESKPSLCDILSFYPKDNVTPAASVNEVSTGKYRVAAIRAMSETATGAKELKPAWEKYLARYKKKHKMLQKQKQKLLQSTDTENKSEQPGGG
jgi:uncharacterized Rossmann fold enzyme